MKAVLLTGGTRGIGLAIARRLSADGYRVIACGRKETPDLAALASSNAVAFEPLDLEDTDGIAAFAQRIFDRHGGIYGLVNNAGIGTDGVLGTMHNRDIERVMKVNAVAPMILTKYVSRRMLAAGEGRVINISSVVAHTGYSGLAAYAASKAALEGFTRSLARELGRRGITANAVAPGFVRTEMTHGLEGPKLESILRRSPLNRLAEADEIAGAVAYLMSPAAGGVTGTVLTVDAGSTA